MNSEQRTILLATDADEVAAEVASVLGDSRTRIVKVDAGAKVIPAIREHTPQLVVLDLQIGNMGGVATSLAIRNESGAGRLEPQNVLLLLDRVADVFIARRSEADGWIIKPMNPLRLQRAAAAVIEGGFYTEQLSDRNPTRSLRVAPTNARSAAAGSDSDTGDNGAVDPDPSLAADGEEAADAPATGVEATS